MAILRFSRFGFSTHAQGLSDSPCSTSALAIREPSDVALPPCSGQGRHTEKRISELKPGLRSRVTDAQHDVVTAVAPPRKRSRWLLVLRKKTFILIQKPVYPAPP